MRVSTCVESDFTLRYPIVKDGKKFTKLKIREMDGADEEQLSFDAHAQKDPDMFLFKAIVRGIAEVKGYDGELEVSDIEKLPMEEIDRLAGELRFMTFPGTYNSRANCPHCKKVVEISLDREDIINEVSGKIEERSVDLQRGIQKEDKLLKKANLNIYTGEVRRKIFGNEKVSSENLGKQKTKSLLAIIKDVDGVELTEQDVQSMKKADRELVLSTFFSNIKPVLNTEVGYECAHCGEDFDVQVNVLDFLL